MSARIEFLNSDGRRVLVNSDRIVYVAGPLPGDPEAQGNDYGFVVIEGLEHPIMLDEAALSKIETAIYAHRRQTPLYMYPSPPSRLPPRRPR